VDIHGNGVLVTGGASGLGEATARWLHGRGARVVLFDLNAERGTAIAEELGEGAAFVAGSTLSDGDTAAAIAAVQTLAPLRGVVACAGGAPRSARTLDRDGAPHDRQLFDDIVAMNLTGTFNTVRLTAAAMAAQEPDGDDGERGAIVLTASIAGYEGQIGQIAYGSAKAGIIGMTIVAARDLAVHGIRVNTVAPGTIGTRAWDQAPAEMRQAFEAKVPFPRRFGRPEEFAALVEHLLVNGYLNGEVFRLDGAIRFDPR
jgi:NAD(P)-dependent dehydrogenase (short-subunit alcohol dehydrogenase family)